MGDAIQMKMYRSTILYHTESVLFRRYYNIQSRDVFALSNLYSDTKTRRLHFDYETILF